MSEQIDQELTRGDIDDYMRDLVASRLAADPSYGELPPAYHQLPEYERVAIGLVLGYLLRKRAPYRHMIVNSRTLYDTRGLDQSDVDAVHNNGALEFLSDKGMDGKEYILSPPYNDHLLALNYGPSQ
jgi:hypothetical protein